MLDILTTCTDGGALLRQLREFALEQPGVRDDTADAFVVGYLAAYVATANRAREQAGDDVRPLTDAEVDELLVNVSVSKLQKLLDERRRELADTPDELRETLQDIGGGYREG